MIRVPLHGLELNTSIKTFLNAKRVAWLVPCVVVPNVRKLVILDTSASKLNNSNIALFVCCFHILMYFSNYSKLSIKHPSISNMSNKFCGSLQVRDRKELL